MIEAWVSMGSMGYSLNDALMKLTHVRGFGHATSYCVVDVFHSTQNVMSEVMNHGTFKICYGKDGWNTPWHHFSIISVDNDVQMTDVKVRIVGVEPGFKKMTEQVKIKSYAGQTTSEIATAIARTHELKPVVAETAGKYTFVQTNVTDLQFLNSYLLPISTDRAGSAPYLMTIDDGNLYFQPPSLKKRPQEDDELRNHIMSAHIDMRIHKFAVHNQGILSDFTAGSQLTSYGYNFTQNGSTTYKDKTATANPNLLNKSPYESGYARQQSLPYPEKWMIIADNRNRVARAQFVIAAEAVVEGRADLTFDENHQITIPQISSGGERNDGGLIEYSGMYYVWSVAHVIRARAWLAHLELKSNAFRFSKSTEEPEATGQIDVVKSPIRM